MSDIYMLQSSDLDKFVQDHVQADSLFLNCCGEVIDTLVRHLQQSPDKLKPKHVLKSGSLGKGTAVKGRADIDLVIMLNEYNDVDKLMSDMNELLKVLRLHVLKKTNVKHQKTTRYSVQIQVTCSKGHDHDVDILPAVDLLAVRSLDEIFKKMKDASPTDIHEYSVSLEPLQLEIIKSLPPKVQSLIKLIKYWKNDKLKEKNESEMPSFSEKRVDRPNWPNSYALELIILSAWNDAGNPESFDMAKALHAVLTSFVNYRSFRIVLHKQMKYDKRFLDPKSKTPYIMDPANPYNDMYHGLVGGEAFDWDKVAVEAQRWLSKRVFSVVRASTQW